MPALASQPSTIDMDIDIDIPAIPTAKVADFISHLTNNPDVPLPKLLEPYKAYESTLRKLYAQNPKHPFLADNHVATVPLFSSTSASTPSPLLIHARDLEKESQDEREKYIMSLSAEERRDHGTEAVVGSLKEFQGNFSIFSEAALGDLDWSNIVAAGSAVTSCLVPVPEEWRESKRSLREYYHQDLAPASDVDLFLYGLNEEQALEKIKQIERNIKDSILSEVTTIRTKNAITIASTYPTRHVQIVLRLYDSISQILTGFDVDCACVAYDGKQVYAAPRAITAFMTQTNTIDLSRRSPSYENRLSKYSHRGFEVHWPSLERNRIDPTIFERSFGRTQGLARLLILEKLPRSSDRDAYMDQRREERGRPSINRGYRNQFRNSGNIKDNEEDEIAEWVEQEDVASYHTMTVPYGIKYNAANINRLLYAKDLLLNAEWNQQKDRDVYLHRHPCFFGTAEEVLTDCCGFCPVPKTDEEIKIAEEESKTMVSGPLKFLVEDPGRQEIGSFNPITDDEWTTMAYVGDTARLCQAIVDNDVEHVQDWCSQEGVDVNRRDYTGRTPLHLATMVSTPEVVKCLIDHGARMIARLQDGRTALHIAAARGNAEMVKLLMDRSLANEEEEESKEEARKAQRKAEREAAGTTTENTQEDASRLKDSQVDDDEGDEDVEMDDEESEEASEIDLDSEEGSDALTQGSFVKVDAGKAAKEEAMLEDSDEDPDVYDIDVIAWDFGLSPLHLAILNGHQHIIDLLVSEYGADVLNPVKFVEPGTSTPKGAIMSILLTLGLPTEKGKAVVKQLLGLGATSAQGDMHSITAFHYVTSENSHDLLDVILENDKPVALSVLNHLSGTGNRYGGSNFATPLISAISKGNKEMVTRLLDLGAEITLDFDKWVKQYLARNDWAKNQAHSDMLQRWENETDQPIILAAGKGMGTVVEDLLAHGADPNSLEKTAYNIMRNHDAARYNVPQTLLDVIRQKLRPLKEFKGDEERKPEILKDDDQYLEGYEKGTYSHWSIQNDVRMQKTANAKEWKEYNERQDKGPAEGVKERREAIDKSITELEHAEKTLLAAGAKTFEELHPEVPKSQQQDYNSYSNSNSPFLPFKASIDFSTPDLNAAKKEGYTKLFEATWNGDLATIKSLTLAQWKSTDPDFKDLQPPLKIAIQDSNGFSPFSIAVLRGHHELSQKIIEICLTQYQKDGNSASKRWTMKTGDVDSNVCSEDDSDCECDSDEKETHKHLPIFAELVSDKFTVDNLGEVATMVKSDVLALDMIQWPCKPARILPSKDVEANDRINLLGYAIHADNIEMFRFMMKIGAEQQALLAEDEDDARCFNVDVELFRVAIRLGRINILGEMIQASGVGIPLNDLIKEGGVELKAKPKYYQGLSVGGKKRSDWAQAPGEQPQVVEESSPPLLTAARNANIDSVEWFTSSAPLRKYKEFAEANKHDKRIKTLESGKGFDKTIETWLKSNCDLIFFAAVTAPYDDETLPKYIALLEHILSVSPDLLEKKSSEGYTPLQVAVLGRRLETVKYLISKGANQRHRDKAGRNMMHSLVVAIWGGHARNDAGLFKSIVECFDKKKVQEMFTERCTVSPGALTPLGLWFHWHGREHKRDDIVSILTEYSTGEDLEMINGEGDLPLHIAVRSNLSSIAAKLLTLNPQLLYRENSTGRTPLEMAIDKYTSSRVEEPLDISLGRYSWDSYRPGQDEYWGITKRPVSDFAPKKEEPEENAKRTWEACVAVDARLASEGVERKRRLVSLFEANEVARRVAGHSGGVKKGLVVNGGLVNADVKRDLVSEWICKSVPRCSWLALNGG